MPAPCCILYCEKDITIVQCGSIVARKCGHYVGTGKDIVNAVFTDIPLRQFHALGMLGILYFIKVLYKERFKTKINDL